MKLAWMFGSSLGAHHLLWAYLAVWLIQGGYAMWIGLQWMRTKNNSRAGGGLDSETQDS
ncbi:MAG TPA: hypothetical protein VF865_11675 [Acidobacteriaceae bacterium]